jgi:hypothetical protein
MSGGAVAKGLIYIFLGRFYNKEAFPQDDFNAGS